MRECLKHGAGDRNGMPGRSNIDRGRLLLSRQTY